ncbi:hypothetical protein Glove_155g70 [Diversispora epigaea]|uniref:Protein kinase domain-containing protein n=1 Tax=Diversispora epigaea TaxID=1348612 RepID=A0A397IVX2_9GLOM|nr:hypothetical protein Glove_155g70 [Diversispora epigaea]
MVQQLTYLSEFETNQSTAANNNNNNFQYFPMSQETEKIVYCGEGHSSKDLCSGQQNRIILNYGICDLCSCEHYIQEFKTWSSENTNIDKIIQESQRSNIYRKLQWIPYDNFQNIKHIADGGRGSMYSADFERIKRSWNFIKQDWKYDLIGEKVALKEIKDSRYDIAEFFKVITSVDDFAYDYIAEYYGISKNPFTRNYIIVMELSNDDLHNFLSKNFWDLGWETKIDIVFSIARGLEILHSENLVHCDLHSKNILHLTELGLLSFIGLDLCKLENDLILNANDKNNKIYGLIPYIPPEVLRGNEFTKKGDVYSFGGIMYEIVTAQRPFADKAHDTYLMIDICNGVRPKVPDFMLNWIPEWYLNLMYRCWSDDPSERPTAAELGGLFREAAYKLYRLDLCKLENDLILNANDKNNKIYGLIPYIPPEVLRGNEFTKKGDVYSFGGIMYEIVTAQRPFADKAHDTYLMIDICNGVRPKVPDFMLNWIPEWYLNLMYRCWSDDPSERPTAAELGGLFREAAYKLYRKIVDNNVMRQLKIADENQKNTSKSQKQELFKLFSSSSKLHPQSCYTGRYIHTLHRLRDILEDIKSGKSSDPNLLKPNEPTI